jgi:shikimate dehydrogenase
MIGNSSVGGKRSKILLGLIGSGIQGSKSPAMHESETAAQGVLCIYNLIDLAKLGLQVDALPDLLTAAERMGFAGLNITHPCKQAVMPHLTDISEDARALGAVNTVVLRDGKRVGHNTDWVGYVEGFKRGLPGASIKNIVQLGAGGAGAAVAYGMLKLGAAHITIVDPREKPNVARCIALVERMAAIFGQDRISFSTDAAGSVAAADGVINTTAVGMASHPGTAMPVHLLRPDLWVSEIVYFPLETELLRAARAIGSRTLDGTWMVVYQAAEAMRLFAELNGDAERMHQQVVPPLPSQ